MNRLLYPIIFVAFSFAASNASACRQSALLRSKSLIDAVLKDVVKTYKGTGGGGITNIQMTATDVYKVSIAQEEKVDEITYNLTTETNCSVKISRHTESARAK